MAAEKKSTKSTSTQEAQRESMTRWLDEREKARQGKPLSPEAIQFAEQAWSGRK
jgi:hypothetical protein